MKKALMIIMVLCMAVVTTACINNMAVQELNNKAAQYMQNGDYDAAISRLQASLDLDAGMYETYYNLGVAAISAKKYDVAIDALQRGLKVKPEFSNFYYSLGVAQYSLADDYMEVTDDNSNEDSVSDTDAVVSVTKDITPEVREKAVKLKKLSILSFEKYLKLEPNATDANSVREMIQDAQQFVERTANTEKSSAEQEESAQ